MYCTKILSALGKHFNFYTSSNILTLLYIDISTSQTNMFLQTTVSPGYFIIEPCSCCARLTFVHIIMWRFNYTTLQSCRRQNVIVQSVRLKLFIYRWFSTHLVNRKGVTLLKWQLKSQIFTFFSAIEGKKHIVATAQYCVFIFTFCSNTAHRVPFMVCLLPSCCYHLS